MCLLVISNQPDKIVFAANRDEFNERHTREAQWWPEAPHLLAGKDLQAGGTWMGVTTNGKFAAVTNFRKFPQSQQYLSSRGDLVKNFLTGNFPPETYFEILQEHGQEYDGFNLMFGQLQKVYYFSNRGNKNGKINWGTHGLSNHLLNTPRAQSRKSKE